MNAIATEMDRVRECFEFVDLIVGAIEYCFSVKRLASYICRSYWFGQVVPTPDILHARLPDAQSTTDMKEGDSRE